MANNIDFDSYADPEDGAFWAAVGSIPENELLKTAIQSSKTTPAIRPLDEYPRTKPTNGLNPITTSPFYKTYHELSPTTHKKSSWTTNDKSTTITRSLQQLSLDIDQKPPKELEPRSKNPFRQPLAKRTPVEIPSKKRVIVIEDTDEDEQVEWTFKFKTSSQSSPQTLSPQGSTFSITPDASSSSSSSSSSCSSPPPSSLSSSICSSDSSIGRHRTKPQSIPTNALLQSIKGTTPSYKGRSNAPSSVIDITNAEFGTALEPFVISHCDATQRMMDKKNIAWGVQYELARGVTLGLWGWSDVRLKLDQLGGSNADVAHKVRSVLNGTPSRNVADLAVWKELDREQLAITEGVCRGLGLMGSWQGVPDWHGGQVQQIARFEMNNSDHSYKIVLQPLEKRRSHRFARFCGSRRILQLRIPEMDLMKDNLRVKNLLNRKFVLCGRIFVPFYAKDNSLYMVETDENWGRKPQRSCGDEHRLPFADFINWHNGMDYNWEQSISKWVTRFAIGLSNSIPALEFEEKNIRFIDDIYAPDYSRGMAEKIMTDGCGLINNAALLSITRKFGYPYLVTAVQARIAGAKGMFLLHPTDESDEPKIWVRKSQNKINYPSLDKAHCILDLLCASHSSPSIALSQQSILNMSFNGTPTDVFISLLEKGLRDEVEPLLDWDRQNAGQFLWNVIDRRGNVSGVRAQRLAAGASRVLGLKGREWRSEDADIIDDEMEPLNSSSAIVHAGRDPYSGAPLSLYETTLELLQAGFDPTDSKFLRSKIKYIVQQTIESSIEKYRIPLAESLTAFAVPDPLGILKEGEMYYRSCQPIKDPKTETLWQVLTGKVVLGRYPMRLPCDMQKVVAVDVPELWNWPDVVIVSTQGSRSLMSLLGGGDTDGDEVIIVREPELVLPFSTKGFTEPPQDLIKNNFEPQVESVTSFCERIQCQSLEAGQKALQEILLSSLNDSKKGLYSMYHDRAILKYGYDHPKSIRLAYIFCTLLDASKTGLRLRPGIAERDSKEFGNLDKKSPESVLGQLVTAGTTKGRELMQHFEVLEWEEQQDKDLMKPYDTATEYALQAHKHGIPRFAEEMERIRNHVEEAFKIYVAAVGRRAQGASKKTSNSKAKELMTAASRKFAEVIPDIVLTPNVEQIRASYAYVSHPKTNFPFQVAFRDLCLIKAMATPGGIAPSTRLFDEAKNITGSSLRALERNDEERF